MTEIRLVIERARGNDWIPAADWKPAAYPKNLDKALATLAALRADETHGAHYRLVRITREIIVDAIGENN